MGFRSFVVGSMLTVAGCSSADVEPVVDSVQSTESAIEESAADANTVAQSLSLVDEVFDPDVARDRDVGLDIGPDAGRDVGADHDARVLRHVRMLGEHARGILRRCGEVDVVGPDLRVDFGDGCQLRDGMHVKGAMILKVRARGPGGPGSDGAGLDLSITFAKLVVRGVRLDGGLGIGDRDKDGWRNARFDGLKRDDSVLDGSIGMGGKRDQRILDGEIDTKNHSIAKKLVFKRLVLESDHCYPKEGSIGFDGRDASKGVIDFDRESPTTGIGRVRDGAGPGRDVTMPAFGRCANPEPKPSR